MKILCLYLLLVWVHMGCAAETQQPQTPPGVEAFVDSGRHPVESLQDTPSVGEEGNQADTDTENNILVNEDTIEETFGGQSDLRPEIQSPENVTSEKEFSVKREAGDDSSADEVSPDDNNDNDLSPTTSAVKKPSGDIGRCEISRTLREPCGYQINTTESYCLSLGCCWDPTHDELENKAHCYHMIAAQTEFKPDEYTGAEPFCATGQFLLGDVNADGYSDQFCFNDGELKIRLGALTEPYKEDSEKTVILTMCEGARVQLGDVNGDGRSDVVCSKDGAVMVWESKDIDNFFEANNPWKDALFGFCKNDLRSFLSDFDGDGMTDALCMSDNGRTLTLGDAAGTFLAKVKDPNFDDFCTETKDIIHVGDFDADGRSDLVCSVNGGEKYQIALTDGDGFLVNEDFETVESWCDKDDDTFLVADTNGDKHDDWVCHHGDGRVCTKYNSHIFGAVPMFANYTKTCDAIIWCKDGDVSVGDLNADEKDDLFCRKDDKTSVATSNIKSTLVNFIQVDWNSTENWGTNFCGDKEIYTVDINNDQREDVVCHDYKGGIIQTVLGDHYGRLVESSKFKPDPFRFCHIDHQNPEKPTFLTGDVNGDGRTDLLCVHDLSGDLMLTKATGSGTYETVEVVKENFCPGKDRIILVADFDGDNKADVACGSEDKGKVILHIDEAKNEKEFSGSWCNTLESEVLIGNFIKGKPRELICHDRKTGVVSLLLLESDNQLKGENLNLPSNWCVSTNSQALKAGDFNGDSLTDLLCHNQTGEMKIVLHLAAHKKDLEWFGHEFQTKTDFCPEIGSELTVYDANGDGYDDLTCHTSQGKITISESHLVEASGVTKTDLNKKPWPPLNPDEYYPFDDLNDLTWNQDTTVKSPPPEYAFRSIGKVGKAVEVKAANKDWIQLDRGAPECLNNPNCTEGFSIAFWLKAECDDYNVIMSTEKDNQGLTLKCHSDKFSNLPTKLYARLNNNPTVSPPSCPADFSLTAGSCFHVSPGNKYNWDEAKQYCETLVQGESRLATIDAPGKSEALRTMVSYAWIGARANSSGIYIHEHTGIPVSNDMLDRPSDGKPCVELERDGKISAQRCAIGNNAALCEITVAESGDVELSPLPNGWAHIVLTLNPPTEGLQADLYLNGTLMHTITFSDDQYVMSNENFVIARMLNRHDQYGSFIMDELVIWDRKLSEQEVETLYSSYG